MATFCHTSSTKRFSQIDESLISKYQAQSYAPAHSGRPPSGLFSATHTAPFPPATAQDWIEGFAPDGRPYYYNKVTGQSLWERPAVLSNEKVCEKAAKD